MRRIAILLVLVGTSVLLAAAPAGACGGLVGENGTIQLTRTSTLAAHHNGIERYVTSFEFTGTGEEVGSIVPLPGVPTKVERGGDWTLQRLEQEVRPPLREAAAPQATAGALDKAEVILETKIDALDITVLRGGGNAVGKWALDHGFLLTPDTPQVLDFYSRRSKIFMAARFDASRARQLGQTSGDGTPIMVTIPTEEPWVPLRILALGQGKTKVVDADVFLLTDQRPLLRTGGPGLTLERSDEASSSLLADLRSDKGMKWVPDGMWLTYLRVDTPAKNLDYDLAVSTHDGVLPSARMVGFGVPGGPKTEAGSGFPVWDFLGIAGGVLAVLTAIAVSRRRASAAS
ncbi:MAG: DUF2330 domain-containing protein [Acidimicrobiia bacterium]